LSFERGEPKSRVDLFLSRPIIGQLCNQIPAACIYHNQAGYASARVGSQRFSVINERAAVPVSTRHPILSVGGITALAGEAIDSELPLLATLGSCAASKTAGQPMDHR
jgi:hypothetical protein